MMQSPIGYSHMTHFSHSLQEKGNESFRLLIESSDVAIAPKTISVYVSDT